jgi:cold-inducible RNA-binding protein
MSMNIYVGNLPYRTNENELNDLFSVYGEVQSAKVIIDRDTGRSKGFGFVEMVNQSDGERAISELNGKDIDGRQIRVNEAKPRTGGGDRGRGRDRY